MKINEILDMLDNKKTAGFIADNVQKIVRRDVLTSIVNGEYSTCWLIYMNFGQLIIAIDTGDKLSISSITNAYNDGNLVRNLTLKEHYSPRFVADLLEMTEDDIIQIVRSGVV
jgi:hypothetical protein